MSLEILFNYRPDVAGDPYSRLLLDLYKIENAKGKPTWAGSFVSKLVAIHEEDRPIFDSRVASFFGIQAPLPQYEIDHRIAMFIRNLDHVRCYYLEWQRNQDIVCILNCVRKSHNLDPEMHDFRVMDYLVWAADKLQITEHRRGQEITS